MRIDDLIALVLADSTWQAFELEMTKDGFERFAEVTAKAPTTPIVYVHVEQNSGRVLRIGKSLRGIRPRWLTKSDSHHSTFEWAMGWGSRYQKKSRTTANYVLFFWRLFGMKTEVWTIDCCPQSCEAIESLLIAHFEPVWEKFREECKQAGLSVDDPHGQIGINRQFDHPMLPTIDKSDSQLKWMRTQATKHNGASLTTPSHDEIDCGAHAELVDQLLAQEDDADPWLASYQACQP